MTRYVLLVIISHGNEFVNPNRLKISADEINNLGLTSESIEALDKMTVNHYNS